MNDPAEQEQQAQQAPTEYREEAGAASAALHVKYRERVVGPRGVHEVVEVETVRIWGTKPPQVMHIVRYAPSGIQQHRPAFAMDPGLLDLHFEMLKPVVLRAVGFGGPIFDRPTRAQATNECKHFVDIALKRPEQNNG